MRAFVTSLMALAICACGSGDDAPSDTAAPSATVAAATPAPRATLTTGRVASRWHPDLHPSWQWQLGDLPLDTSVEATMYDIDLFDNDAAVVAELHAAGRLVVCYLSADSHEDWRPDAGAFPDEVLGNELEGWPGERWLDIRRIDLLAPLMEARLDHCAEKGFDAVEPDNVDGYLHDSGFDLTYADQLDYNRWLADAAHARGLDIALKNDGEQIEDLLDWYDFAVVEECYEYDACELWLPFVAAGKAVFIAEYALATGEFCPHANAANYSAILKDLDLTAWREPCR